MFKLCNSSHAICGRALLPVILQAAALSSLTFFLRKQAMLPFRTQVRLISRIQICKSTRPRHLKSFIAGISASSN